MSVRHAGIDVGAPRRRRGPAARVLAWLALAALVATGSAAFAHAMLQRASPAVGSRVPASPPRVELWFTERLEPAFSSVKVLDASGRQVDKGDGAVDARDRTHLGVSVPALPPGRYKVAWRAVSVDSHATSGDHTFEVGP